MSARERREWEHICAHYSDDPSGSHGDDRAARFADAARNLELGVRRQSPYIALALVGCVVSVSCAQPNLDRPVLGIMGMLLVLTSYCLWRMQ